MQRKEFLETAQKEFYLMGNGTKATFLEWIARSDGNSSIKKY